MSKYSAYQRQPSAKDAIGAVTTLLLMAVPFFGCLLASPIHSITTGFYILIWALPLLVLVYVAARIFSKRHIKRYSPASIAFLVTFLLGLNTVGDMFIANVFLDKSAPDIRVASVVDKMSLGRNFRSIYIDNPGSAPLPFLQSGHTGVHVERWDYFKIHPGVTQVQLELHKGYFGFMWINHEWQIVR